ncbi:MlaD family protein [Williamsia sp. MIQD14]|uniref:MlaD family protein n=1 Tax=Williamsia sp. MIQD14 TaxID=3425703 RepID=UPI003DA02928
MAIFKDLSGRAPSRGSQIVRGVAVLVVVIVGGYFLVGTTTKVNADRTFTLKADVIGDGLKGGSEVKYRGLTVGRVADVKVRDRGTTVKIEFTGGNGAINPKQGLSVNYTSANALGPTALEIVDLGDGAPVRNGGVVSVSRARTAQTSVSTLIRKISNLVEVLDQPSFNAVTKFIVDDSQTFADTGKLAFQIAQLARDVQRRPVGRDLTIAADLSQGVADFMKPFVPGIFLNVDIAEFFGNQRGIDLTKSNLKDTGEVLFGGLGGLLSTNYAALSSLLDVGLDLIRPVARSASGLVRTVDSIPRILDGIDKATPRVDNKVQLQVALIIRTSPALQSALAAERTTK